MKSKISNMMLWWENIYLLFLLLSGGFFYWLWRDLNTIKMILIYYKQMFTLITFIFYILYSFYASLNSVILGDV